MTNGPMPAWALPLLVALLIVPAVGATLLVGAGAGLAAALITLVGVVVIATRAPDEPIETDAAAEPEALVVLKAALTPGRDGDLVARYAGDSDVHVIVPAQATRLERWLSATDEATAEAQSRLDEALHEMERPGGHEVHGEVGDPDPVRAVEDAARTRAVEEVVFITDDPGDPDAREVGRRLARDVHVLVG